MCSTCFNDVFFIVSIAINTIDKVTAVIPPPSYTKTEKNNVVEALGNGKIYNGTNTILL